MAYDEGTAQWIREVIVRLPLLPGEEITESKMFGGICFMLNKKMLIGIAKENLVVRLHDEEMEVGLATGKVQPMDFTGKPLRNFAYLPSSSWQTDEAMLDWMEKSAAFVRDKMLSKPAKKKR